MLKLRLQPSAAVTTGLQPLRRLRAYVGSLPRDSRDTLFLLGVIGWLLLPQLALLPWWTSALAYLMLAWRGWLAVGARPLPPRAMLVLLLAVTLVATWITHRTLLGREAGVTLVVALLALKTLELRARRDAFVVFFLGFFTMLTSFFSSQSMATALVMLLGLLGLLTALVNAHLPVGRPPLLYSARTAGRMMLFGAPVMAVLFVLFPRLSPLWGIPADAMSGRSGLSADMRVGNVASLALDDSIAMRVLFEGERPPRDVMYFRGPVLGQFDGRSWKPLSILTNPVLSGGVSAAAMRRAPLHVSGEPVRYEVTLEPNNRPFLMVLDIAAERPNVAAGLFVTPELQWLLLRPVTDLLRYSAVSHVQWRQGPFETAALLPNEYRDLPPGSNPRTLQLATELMRQSTAPASDKAALVRAALQMLRTGGYSYTLDPGLYGEHTADEFWFDRKEGFCEHIASAFAVLMRGMDIPARIVTGYQGGEVNNVDGYWVVRNSDAHAWVEVWLAGRGWVRVDPTGMISPERIGTLRRLIPRPNALVAAVDAVNPTLAADLRAIWDAVNNAWNQRILNYTQSRQLELLRSLGFRSPDWLDLLRALFLALGGAALVAAAWAAWERMQHDPWLRLLGRVRKRLNQSGLVLSQAYGPRQIATIAQARWGAKAQGLADWLLRLEAQRYARQPSGSLRRLRREFRRLPWPTS